MGGLDLVDDYQARSSRVISPTRRRLFISPSAHPGLESRRLRTFSLYVLSGCCHLVTLFPRQSDMLIGIGEGIMFDVYVVSNKRDRLLVIPRGVPIPMQEASKKWRRRRKSVVAVSEEIKLAVKRNGYYRRG